MRNVLPKILHSKVKKNKNIVILLGDIGVFGFKKIFKDSKNVHNMSTLEQSMMGFASGLAINNKKVYVYSIAPFVVERCFEQIKVDLCYQKKDVNIISCGGSIEYSELGCTHHCPEDVSILKKLPNIEIFMPGNNYELSTLINQNNSKLPSYTRLSKSSHNLKFKIKKNKANCLQKVKSSKLLLVVFGPSLRFIENYMKDLKINVLYYSTIRPFDVKSLQNFKNIDKIILLHELYSGSLVDEITNNFKNKVKIYDLGLPVKFFENYGSEEEQYNNINLNPKKIFKRIKKIINEK